MTDDKAQQLTAELADLRQRMGEMREEREREKQAQPGAEQAQSTELRTRALEAQVIALSRKIDDMRMADQLRMLAVADEALSGGVGRYGVGDECLSGDVKVAVDSAAEAGFLGAAYNDGVLRVGIESVVSPVTAAVEHAGLRWQDAGNH
jgi:hypothetical protein